jgi:hypothetical protein
MTLRSLLGRWLGEPETDSAEPPVESSAESAMRPTRHRARAEKARTATIDENAAPEPCGHALTQHLSGFTRCMSCGLQWFPGGAPASNGLSRKQYADGDYRRFRGGTQ